MSQGINSKIFKAYDIRGTYPNELNVNVAKKIGNATTTFLNGKTLVVGEDGRTSSPELRKAVIEGISDFGCNIIYIGQTTTPMFYYACAVIDNDGGIMVTASHNPPEYNGFKIVGKDLKPVGEGAGIEKIRELASGDYILSKNRGIIKEKNILDSYVDFLTKTADPDIFKARKKRVVIDASNGVSSIILKPLLDRLKIDYIPLHFEIDGNFPNHLSDITKPENNRDLREKVISESADIGFALDGDGDRVIICDNKGNVIKSDYILALLHEYLYKGSTAIYDLRFSRSIREALGSDGIVSRHGHTFMKMTMRKVNASIGAEVSGHFFFKEFNYADSDMLVIIKILQILNQTNRPIGELVKPYDKYYHSGEININISSRDIGQKILNIIMDKYKDDKLLELDGVTIDCWGNHNEGKWWANAVLSNTEPVLRLVVESDSKELMEEKVAELKKIIISS